MAEYLLQPEELLSRSAVNGAESPIEVVLQTRVDLDPGDIDAARVRWTSSGGEKFDKRLIVPGEPPTGSEIQKAMQIPAGEWALARSGSTEIVNRFPIYLVERTALSWTPKGGPRATLGIWSRKRTLAPGERLCLESDYR